MKKTFRTIFATLAFAISCNCLFSQINCQWFETNKSPLNKGFFGTVLTTSAYVVPHEDIQKALLDSSIMKNDTSKIKYIIGVVIPININTESYCTKITSKNGVIRKLSLSAPGAKGVSICFDKLILNPESEMILYNSSNDFLMGPIKEKDINTKEFYTDAIPGETVNIEIFDPTGKAVNEINISKIVYGIKEDIKNPFNVLYSSKSADCEVNVKCSAGDNFLIERDGITKITHVCGATMTTYSGCLIENTSYSFTPYVLTAHHCIDANDDGSLSVDEKNAVSSMVCRFFYESSSCSSNLPPTNYVYFEGAQFKSAYRYTDMALVQLLSTPADCRISYLGWDRTSSMPTKLTCLHHPLGEVMKISIDNNGSDVNLFDVPIDYPAIFFPANYAHKVVWNTGITEQASSGAPFLNQSNRVVGQLGGGGSSCSGINYYDYGGRLYYSWNTGGTSDQRLKDWLDPINSQANYTATKRNGEVLGPDIICSTGNYQYTLSNPPSGVTVTWTATPSSYYSPSSGTGSVANVNANASNNGYGTIIFTVPHPSKGTITFQKTVWFGLANPNSLDILNPYNNPDNTLCGGEQNQLVASSSGYQTSTILDYNWDYSGWSHFEVGAKHFMSYVTVPSDFSSKNIKLRAVNQCGSSSWRIETFYPNSQCSGYAFTIFPNPADDVVEINILKDGNIDNSDFIYQIKVFSTAQRLVYESSETGEKVLRIDTKQFTPGNYFVQLIADGKIISVNQLVVNH